MSRRRSTRSPSCAWPRRARAGTTTIRGAGELRHKESDRIAGVAAGLAALGADIEVDGDDIAHPRRRPAARRRDRQPRRPPARDDVRDRRPRRRPADDDRAARVGRGLLSRLLRRSRRGASMTKRVVLIGHPVAHSLSGAMQQAAFDELGIDARYELWDRAADRARRRRRRAARRRLPRRERHDPAQGAGRADGRPPDRGGVGHRRGQHDHARGPPADRPQHRRRRASRSRSTSSSVGRRCPSRPSCSARAVARGRSCTA